MAQSGCQRTNAQRMSWAHSPHALRSSGRCAEACCAALRALRHRLRAALDPLFIGAMCVRTADMRVRGPRRRPWWGRLLDGSETDRRAGIQDCRCGPPLPSSAQHLPAQRAEGRVPGSAARETHPAIRPGGGPLAAPVGPGGPGRPPRGGRGSDFGGPAARGRFGSGRWVAPTGKGTQNLLTVVPSGLPCRGSKPSLCSHLRHTTQKMPRAGGQALDRCGGIPILSPP